MMEWFTLDKVKAAIYLLTFFAGIAGWYDGYQQRNEVKATREQVTTIVNYYYDEGCKP